MLVVSIYRPLAGDKNNRVAIKIPYMHGNRQWFKQALRNNRIRPTWDEKRKVWLIARNHYPDLLAALRSRFGNVDVFEDYSLTERCHVKCQEGKIEHADLCECSCMGKYHGYLQGGGRIIDETGIILYHDRRRRAVTYRA